MAYNLDPFMAYLPAPEIPGSTPPPTEEALLRRQKRLETLGLNDGVMGDVNNLALKAAGMRSTATDAMKGSLMKSGAMKWAASM